MADWSEQEVPCDGEMCGSHLLKWTKPSTAVFCDVQPQTNFMYVFIGRYHFEYKDLAKVFSYLVQLNYIFNREYSSQARSVLKFIAHLLAILSFKRNREKNYST